MKSSARALVVCIGNELVGDDGAGLAVAERLMASGLPGGVRLIRLGLGGIDLLRHLTGEELLVVVDAVQLGAPVGTIHVLAWEDIPAPRGPPLSAHGIGLREAMDLGRVLYPDSIPHRAMLIGIEGVEFREIGGGLSPEVAAAIEPAAAAVLAELNGAIKRRQ